MPTVIGLLLAWVGISTAALSPCSLTWPDINNETQPKVVHVDVNLVDLLDCENEGRDTLTNILTAIGGNTGATGLSSTGNIKANIDRDSNTTGSLFWVANHTADTLFRVKDDSAAKFFGALAINGRTTLTDSLIGVSQRLSGNLTVAGTSNFAGAPTFSSLTASLPVFTNGSKALASNAMTGTGSVMMSASPTTTGTLTGAAANFSGAVSTGALSATTGAFSSTAAFGAAVVLNNASVTNRTIGWQTNGTDRWGLTVGSTAEGGSNTGSNIMLRAFGDGGSVIDTPFAVARVAGGIMTLARPLNLSASTADRIPYLNGSKNLVTSANLAYDGTTITIGSGNTITASTGAVSLGSTLIQTGGGHTISYSNSGGNNEVAVANTSNTANSNARLALTVQGSSAGDAYTRYSVSGLSDWVTALDNSDGDAFVISESSTPGTANRLKIASGGAVSITGTLDVTGKFTGSDTVAAVLGFRAGGTAASNTIFYRSGADMWTTPDSLTVGGSVRVTDSIVGAAGRFTGRVTADTLVSSKVHDASTYTATLNFNGSSAGVTGSAKYARNYKTVSIVIPILKAACVGTDAITITGRSAGLNPATSQSFSVPVLLADGTYATGRYVVAAGGTDSLFSDAGTASFGCTSSQAHGTFAPITLTYTLQ